MSFLEEVPKAAKHSTFTKYMNNKNSDRKLVTMEMAKLVINTDVGVKFECILKQSTSNSCGSRNNDPTCIQYVKDAKSL